MLLNRLKSFRTHTLLQLIAILLGLSGLIAVLGSWVTHRLKQHLVREAETYAQQEVVKGCERIKEIMAGKGLKTLESAVDVPEVNTELHMVLRRSDGAIQMLAILNRDKLVVRQFQNDRLASERQAANQQPIQGQVEGNATEYSFKVERVECPETAKLETATVQGDSGPAGYLGWRVADNLSGSDRVLRLSRAVSESLAWMVVMLLVLLAATGALLYKVFGRHLELEREKEAQARLATIGTLASGLAHEIRNPLQVIHMNLDLIREEIEGTAGSEEGTGGAVQTARTLGRIQSQVSHLNKILHDFLQYAIPGRLETEKLALRPLVSDTLEFMGPEFVKHGIQVEVTVPEEARVEGDPSALRRVFLNILLNAIKAMEESPEKRLAVGAEERPSGMWEVRFKDTGCGIPKGQEEEIFEAFVSLQPGGTGFGLAIARRIIEEHGGRITAESGGEGRGALFRLTLPSPEPDMPGHAPHHRHTPAASQVS